MKWQFVFKNEIRGLIHLFFPRKCCVCEQFLSDNEKGICLGCYNKIPLTYFWEWKENPAFDRIVRHCTDVTDAVSLFYFRKPSGYEHIPYEIKYRGNRHLGYMLGYRLGMYLTESGRFKDINLIVPVPLHPLRQWKRGYNQAACIAKGIADATEIPIEEKLLSRKKVTGTQTRLTGDEKEENMRNAFSINTKCLEKIKSNGKTHILVVDDTLTSGATLGECANNLTQICIRTSVASLTFVD